MARIQHNLAEKAQPQAAHLPVSTAPVRSWWGLFVTGSMLGNFAARILTETPDITEIMASTALSLLADLLHVAAAILCLYLVHRITKLQQAAQNGMVQPASSPDVPASRTT